MSEVQDQEQSYSLDDFNTEFSDEDVAPRERGTTQFGLKHNTNYPVEITGAKVTTAPWGKVQWELDISQVSENGNLTSLGKRWVTLPTQPKAHEEETNQKFGEERAKLFRRIASDNLLQVLRCIDPVSYSLYDHKTGKGRTAKYYDAAGNELNTKAFTEKEVAINKKVRETSVLIATGIVPAGTVGTRCFATTVTNKKKPERPYENFSRQPNPEFPMAEDPSA